jgi:hypothetical protein
VQLGPERAPVVAAEVVVPHIAVAAHTAGHLVAPTDFVADVRHDSKPQ